MSDATYDPTSAATAKGRSVLTVEWTNQHGCGGNEHGDPYKLNCELIMQYMCLPDDYTRDGENGVASDTLDAETSMEDCTKECYWPTTANPNCDSATAAPCRPMDIRTELRCIRAGGIWATSTVNDQYNCPDSQGAALMSSQPALLRDGLNTNRQEYTELNNAAETQQQRFTRYRGNIQADRGLHENWEWYDECYRRERNRGLFTADQNLRNNNLGYSSAVFTRQNPNNNRRGYECPEERDYYPYWHPSPWKDVVIMTDRLDLCPFYQSESHNVKAKGLCRNTANCANCVKYNNKPQCESNNGRWVQVPAHNIAAPECIQAPWSRVNHLGNGRHGQPNTYNWTLPYINLPGGEKNQTFRCVVRLRYNISTDDYDGWRVNASFNQNNGQGIDSPVQQNPTVNIGAANQGLRLAINTAQFGRTFQDRSHVFRLKSRPKYLTTTAMQQSIMGRRPRGPLQNEDFFANCDTLYNLNVRGKRGNIVQTFPAVEYDFVPNDLSITDKDCVHVQWTGSNTHNNGNPAGDGQAGDAGEGRGGTDRHNWVQLQAGNFKSSYPVPVEANTMFSALKDAVDMLKPTATTGKDIALCGNSWNNTQNNWALRMATVGYYTSLDCPSDQASLVTRTNTLNNLLDNARASYEGGVFQFRYGTYNYMCTRNNNFSNRDQKGVLRVARV